MSYKAWWCSNSCSGIYNPCYLFVTKVPAKREIFFQEKQLTMNNEIMDYCWFGTSPNFWQGFSGDPYNLLLQASGWLGPYKYQDQEQSLLIIVQRNTFLAPFVMSLTLRKIIAKVKTSLGNPASSKIAYSQSRQPPQGQYLWPANCLIAPISFGGWMAWETLRQILCIDLRLRGEMPLFYLEMDQWKSFSNTTDYSWAENNR